MNNFLRKISVAVFIVLLSVLAGGGYYFSRILLDQNRLRGLIQAEIQRKLGQAIAIGQVKLSLGDGLSVDLSAIQLGQAEHMYLSAGNVKLRLSIWGLILGREAIQSILLTSPHLMLRLDDLTKDRSFEEQAFPTMEMEDGAVTVLFKDREFVLSHLNGRVDVQALQLTARFLNAETQIFMHILKSGWKGEVNIKALPLHELNQDINGTADLEIRAEKAGQESLVVETILKAKALSFPGGGQPIQELEGRLAAGLSAGSLELSTVRIGTPFINISGQAGLNSGWNFEKLETADLQFTLATDTFDYEELIRHLPLKILPDWLTVLLARQIRNGRARLESITYTGPLSDFNAQGDFFKRLNINGEILGASFGAGHSQDRITDIQAAVKTSGGDLIFNNIQGTLENMRMGSVNLLFPGILLEGRRVEVNVDVELPGPHFLKAFRAGMWPEAVFHLLDPLDQVQGGLVSAQVVYQEGMSGKKPLIKGNVRVQDGSFTWGKRVFQHLSGTAAAGEFGRPVHAELTGTLNGFPVRRLDLDIQEPLGEARYRFQLEAAQLPQTNRFALDPTGRILVTGTGKGNTINGGVEIQCQGFELLGRHYRLPEGRLEGAGKITARLWPTFSLELTDLELKMPDGRMRLEHHWSEESGSLFLLGTIAAQEIIDGQPSPRHPLKGHVQLKLGWDQSRPFSGQIQFSDFIVHQGGSLVIVNGPLALEGDLLSTKSLSLLRNNTHFLVSGEYRQGTPARFSGNAAIQGLKVGKQDSEETKLPEDVIVEAGLTFSDLEFYDIPFETGSTKARLENGRLKLYGTDLNGPNGSIKGEVEMAKAEPTRLDLHLDLQDQGVQRLLNTHYADKDLIQGKLEMKGRIAGTLKELDGRLSFSAKNGHTMKSSLVTKLFGALNFYKIIKSRNLDLKEERFAFNNIRVNLDLKQGRAGFDDFYLDSDSIQLSAVGAYAVNTGEIDALVGVQPLETIDRAVSAIPVIGWVLTGDDGKLIVVTLSIKGTTAKPEIELAPVNAVSASMADTLLRVLQLPEHIISKSKSLISVKKN